MPHSLKELAQIVSGELEGDSQVMISGLAKIEEANPGELTFLANPKYEKYLKTTQATAVILSKHQKVEGLAVIRVADPYQAFARLLSVFYPEENPLPVGIHPSAVVGEGTTLGREVRIGAHVAIGSGCKIGDEVCLYPNATVGDRVNIGNKTIIRSGVSVRSGVQIGARVIIQDNAVIGSDGFGFAPKAEGDYEKVPQVGTVIIEDDVEMGAGCTIDRATLGATRIEKGAKLDNLIQVAHNVVIGANTVIAAQSGISGSAKIGKGCMIGGQVGFVGHISLGDGSLVGAQSGVSKSFPAGSKISGRYAAPHSEVLRLEASLRQLPDLVKKIDQLEKQIEEMRRKAHGQ